MFPITRRKTIREFLEKERSRRGPAPTPVNLARSFSLARPAPSPAGPAVAPANASSRTTRLSAAPVRRDGLRDARDARARARGPRRIFLPMANSPGVRRDPLGGVEGGPRGRADQRQAPSEGGRVHPRGLRRGRLFVSEDVAGAVAGHSSARSTSAATNTAGLHAGATIAGRRRGARRTRVAVLHVRHDRPTEGRDADASQPAGDDACYFADVDAVEAGRRDSSTPRRCRTARASTACRTSLAGALHVMPESRGFDAGEFFELAARIGDATTVRCADDGQAARRSCAATGTPSRDASGRSSTAARRCTSPTSCGRSTSLGERFVQIYGQGESPMTITALSRAQLADARIRAGPAHRVGRRRAERGGSAGRGRGRGDPSGGRQPARSWSAATR